VPETPAVDLDRRRDLTLLREAIALAGRCPPSQSAYSVGAVIVVDGVRLADGWSRRDDPHDHAEEVALRTLPGLPPAGTTLYSSLEPCSVRSSRPRTCTELVIDAGIRRVVFAWREPDLFVDCDGAERLRAAGVDVVEVPELAEAARAFNAHLF
jgi:diaminohydroxyphosphoribosylaminopyrimidine deaminase/5-amino-6-(5-phosphoribosylamino)uracil reductase